MLLGDQNTYNSKHYQTLPSVKEYWNPRLLPIQRCKFESSCRDQEVTARGRAHQAILGPHRLNIRLVPQTLIDTRAHHIRDQVATLPNTTSTREPRRSPIVDMPHRSRRDHHTAECRVDTATSRQDIRRSEAASDLIPDRSVVAAVWAKIMAQRRARLSASIPICLRRVKMMNPSQKLPEAQKHPSRVGVAGRLQHRLHSSEPQIWSLKSLSKRGTR